LLKNASERTQLIVTTHSEHLIDVMTPTPETVIICEKHDGKTTLRRLDAQNLDLKHTSLAELWNAGDLGGNHW
jgi:predicted ATPase